MNPSGMPDPTATFPDRRQSSTSVGQVFAFVAGFVALAAIGAAIGWYMTGSPKPSNKAAPGLLSSATPVPTTPAPTTSQPTSTSTSPARFVIPDYPRQGTDFITARNELRSHSLGVALVFDEQGSGSSVVATAPPAGTPVTNGITVKIMVSGPAPTLEVDSVIGEGCDKGGKQLAADGLIPQYPLGKKGLVGQTDPAPGASNVTWNQSIKIYCTPDGQPPQPSGGPSTPADGSSTSPGTSG